MDFGFIYFKLLLINNKYMSIIFEGGNIFYIFINIDIILIIYKGISDI